MPYLVNEFEKQQNKYAYESEFWILWVGEIYDFINVYSIKKFIFSPIRVYFSPRYSLSPQILKREIQNILYIYEKCICSLHVPSS